MKVLIEIDEEMYKALNSYPCVYSDYVDEMFNIIRNGNPLNGTNGDALKAVLEDVKTTQKYKGWVEVEINHNHFRVSEAWWNADYRAESESQK